jgi:apolipoprotein N-acyltransferase
MSPNVVSVIARWLGLPSASTDPGVLSDRRSLPYFVIVALIAGGLTVFAFAPFGLWPLQLVAAGVLFGLFQQAPSVRHAAAIGWSYSFAATSVGVHWLYISLHQIGGLPAWLTVLAIGLLSAGLGLLNAAATGGTKWLQWRWHLKPATSLMLILPALWTLAEWTRGWLFTGFPWLSSGYAHTAGPLAGFAPIVGVYGVGTIAALVAAALVLLTMPIKSKPDQVPSHRLKLRAAGLILCCMATGQWLRSVEWTQPSGVPITVRLLQGNVPQTMKFDPAALAPTLALYQTMIEQSSADLIALPETAIPIPSAQLPLPYLPQLAEFAKRSASYLLIGIPVSDNASVYTNSVIGLNLSSAGSTTAATNAYRYDKHHLVPFGEFIPVGFRWFVNLMQIPLGDQTRGAMLQPPFQVKDQWLLPNICYEDLFGEEIAAQIRARLDHAQPAPTMLLNISNIAWFGDSIALPQHLQISQMRAIETGRPMLRATNTGATAVIDPHGKIQIQLAPFTRDTLATSVQGTTGITPYIRFGNGVMLATVLTMLLWAILITYRGRARTLKP